MHNSFAFDKQQEIFEAMHYFGYAERCKIKANIFKHSGAWINTCCFQSDVFIVNTPKYFCFFQEKALFVVIFA